MEIRKIKCDVAGCENEYEEQQYNEGFPGWGHVGGIRNPDTGQDLAHICPEHKAKIIKLLMEGF